MLDFRLGMLSHLLVQVAHPNPNPNPNGNPKANLHLDQFDLIRAFTDSWS